MGLNHIYCGDGKGKTTAAIGLAMRAAGAGIKVYFFQFLKGAQTSELSTMSCIDNIRIERCICEKFVSQMTCNEKSALISRHNEILQMTKKLINSGENLLIVLDEFLDAYNLNMLDKEFAEDILLRHYENAEIVLTGRNPSERFLGNADYVSEIFATKHPFQRGIAARKGIEY